MKLFYLLLIAAALAGFRPACAADIPEAGRIRIDGRLEDWGQMDWMPVPKIAGGNPSDISNASWVLRWDEDAVLYIAVRYDDANIILRDRFIRPSAQDGVEVFVRADSGGGSNRSVQENVQHFFFGLATNRTSVWKKLAELERFPVHHPAEVAIRLNRHTFIYEIKLPLYDRFDPESRRRTSRAEVYPELEIEAGLVIRNGGPDDKAETAAGESRTNAGPLTVFMLAE